jgi:hypothetical protein
MAVASSTNPRYGLTEGLSSKIMRASRPSPLPSLMLLYQKKLPDRADSLPLYGRLEELLVFEILQDGWVVLGLDCCVDMFVFVPHMLILFIALFFIITVMLPINDSMSERYINTSSMPSGPNPNESMTAFSPRWLATTKANLWKLRTPSLPMRWIGGNDLVDSCIHET